MSPRYRGRFAPSPTGPLHFGSLVAAVASYLDARAHHGEWLVRMEDVDTPRNEPGAADRILWMLEEFGFAWDGQVIYQNRRGDAYRAALEQLRSTGLAYPCSCSRKDIGGEVYPGTCRSGAPRGREARAWRLRIPNDTVIDYQDRLSGIHSERLDETCGDFVLLRADDLWAYQLAVVVDDAWQGVTDVVRGEDLLSSTARQIQLQRSLGLPEVSYLHVPLAVDASGQKLSKQTKAPPLDPSRASALLVDALRFLGQPIHPDLPRSAPADILGWAETQWTHYGSARMVLDPPE